MKPQQTLPRGGVLISRTTPRCVWCGEENDTPLLLCKNCEELAVRLNQKKT